LEDLEMYNRLFIKYLDPMDKMLLKISIKVYWDDQEFPESIFSSE